MSSVSRHSFCSLLILTWTTLCMLNAEGCRGYTKKRRTGSSERERENVLCVSLKSRHASDDFLLSCFSPPLLVLLNPHPSSCPPNFLSLSFEDTERRTDRKQIVIYPRHPLSPLLLLCFSMSSVVVSPSFTFTSRSDFLFMSQRPESFIQCSLSLV